MAIAITTVRGGTKPGPAARLIAELSRIAAGFAVPAGPDDERPVVKVVFHLGGIDARPGWSVVQTSRFSKRHRRVQVQVSIPDDLVDPKDLEEFVFRSLREACELAASFFQARDITFELGEHVTLVERIQDRYRTQRRRS
ncbi:MAG: hypothetical protein AAB434_06640 [Planctomycetota bacterium]